MKRRELIKNAGILGAGAMVSNWAFGGISLANDFPVVRTPLEKRHFNSAAIEAAISEFKAKSKNKELGWLFENCFPNTLDTTVDFEMIDGKPDTYVITGDIDAMWLRDSSAQVWPYLAFCKKDEKLQQLIAGVINRQCKFIIKDPYANAFYKDENKISEWKETDITDMKPGVHERKWEIDSLCYAIRLSHGYYKTTGDKTPFDDHWLSAMKLIVKTFKEQQRFNGQGPYTFQRKTAWATDGVPMGGYGYPAKPDGLICSMFRPSDDATIYPYLIPSNCFAVVSLWKLAEMAEKISNDKAFATECNALAAQVEAAIFQHAVYNHPKFGKILAYEVDGYSSLNLMDDANIPCLLSLPYLLGEYMPRFNKGQAAPIIANTRKFVLSEYNPFFFKGKVAEGTGGPHIGLDMIWPMSIVMRGLTSNNDAEIKNCIDTLVKTHGGKGFMHESFHKDNPEKFTRSWFAWANTIFGEFMWKVYKEKPHLI